MVNRVMPTDERGSPPGVFATIAAAFSLLLVNPWPALLPVAVDLWFWQGPSVSPAALAEPLARYVAAQPGTSAQMVDTLRLWGTEGDLTALVGLLTPTLLAGSDRATLASAGRLVLTPGAGGALLFALLAIVLGAILMMTLKTMLVRVLASQPIRDAMLLPDIARNSLRYLGYLALVIGVLLAIVLPAGFVLAVLQVLGIDLLPLFGVAVLSLVVAGTVLLSFVSEAIVIARIGPIAAARLSIRLVRNAPGPAIGFLITLWIALLTVPQLLGGFATTLIGLIVAVLLAAFLTTGLELARLQFFADRWKLPARAASSPRPRAR